MIYCLVRVGCQAIVGMPFETELEWRLQASLLRIEQKNRSNSEQ